MAFAVTCEGFMIFCLIDLAFMTGNVPLVPELIVAAMAMAGVFKIDQQRRYFLRQRQGGSDE